MCGWLKSGGGQNICNPKGVLTYAAAHDYHLHTVDVKTAYLNADLEEGLEIWMKPPRGYEQAADGVPMVCRLVKSIYGLKQGARRWVATLKQGLRALGLECSETDQGVFTLVKGSSRMIMLAYVDDLIIADNCALDRFYIPSSEKAKERSYTFEILPQLVWKQNSKRSSCTSTINVRNSNRERGHDRQMCDETLVFEDQIQKEVITVASAMLRREADLTAVTAGGAVLTGCFDRLTPNLPDLSPPGIQAVFLV